MTRHRKTQTHQDSAAVAAACSCSASASSSLSSSSSSGMASSPYPPSMIIQPPPMYVQHPVCGLQSVCRKQEPFNFLHQFSHTNPQSQRTRRCKGVKNRDFRKFVRKNGFCYRISSKSNIPDEKIGSFDGEDLFFSCKGCNHRVDDRGICSNCTDFEKVLWNRLKAINWAIKSEKIRFYPSKFLDTADLLLLQERAKNEYLRRELHSLKSSVHKNYIESIKLTFQQKRAFLLQNLKKEILTSPYPFELQREYQKHLLQLNQEQQELIHSSSSNVIKLTNLIMTAAKNGNLDNSSFLIEFLSDQLSNTAKSSKKNRRYSDIMKRFW